MGSSPRQPRHGDKLNSGFFEEFLERLLEDRDRSGLSEMIREIDALMITVEPGHARDYVAELSLMTPYHYLVTLESAQHHTHVLRIDLESPDILVREVRNPELRGVFRSLNEVYPIGSLKPNSRYMGEILRVTDLDAVVRSQQAREIRFFSPEQLASMELPTNLAVSKPSPYTHNIVCYWERPEQQLRIYQLGESRILADIQSGYEYAKEQQARLGIDRLILPIDHLATRVYSQNREVAILEYLSLSSYYYWGSFDIADQNSSTNVTKSLHCAQESRSPAKVFTAANHPYFVNHLLQLPSPTEQFVRNYGPRLHHFALAVRDGMTAGQANIDYVVRAIEHSGKDFLLDVVGSREEGLKQIFSSASEHSSLIIEYVQRFDGFEGFFTRDNVAELTEAAGADRELRALDTPRRG
ncbi:hypothetical protein [Thermithiobacillus plumbiphilus]|uniref:Uncharacterized protein n=1 Tax=Thermithiobacillus plumbiphilus TaxID=1729899 RepID=A0ABU9D7R9_9PROT